ncbi:MAG: transketolase [Lachnospiraceae bacterium]|nr:transketolase [Lachnospiraceae bacterium]
MINLNRKDIGNWTRLGMRKAYGSMLESVTEDYPELVALTADVADSANLIHFKEKFPKRFYNIGIAEQNMTGIACGMAKEGHNVFLCSFAPFVSMRNYEAVRTLVGYMNLNVKIVALASGMSLGVQGNTQYCLEDISLMRSIPGMLVLSPADVVEEAKCISFLADYEGPAYLRLTGIDGTPTVFNEDYDFSIHKPALLREGEDVAIISTGSITSECMRATRALKKEGINCALFSICCLKPIDDKELVSIISRYKYIITVEEHFKSNGLGSIISEVVSDSNVSCKQIRLGIDDKFLHAGDYSHMMKTSHLTALCIKEAILAGLK